MSTATDSLDYARADLANARAALGRDDIDMALFHLTAATRYAALALATNAMLSRVSPPEELPGAAEIDDDIARLRREIAEYARPKRADVRVLVDDVRSGIEVLRTLYKIPLTDESILDRARNIVTGLSANYDIRTRKEAT